MLVAWVRRNCRQVVSAPDRRRWDAVALEDPPDRRGADAVAELEQFAADPLVPPARVFRRHPYDQPGDGVVDRWATGPLVQVGPLLAHQAAMPAQDRVGGDQAMAVQRSGQPPDERGEHGPVRPLQAQSGVGAAQHGDLMPQYEQLDVLGGGRATQQQEHPQHPLEDQIQQSQRHGGDHARPLVIINHRWSAACVAFWNPTGHLVFRSFAGGVARSACRGDAPVMARSAILECEGESIDGVCTTLVRVIRRCFPAPPYRAR
jgi:hypothetical protein